MSGIQTQIKQNLTDMEGQIIFPEDYLHLGSPEAVHMALSRLVKQGDLTRLAKGIYLRQKVDKNWGQLCHRSKRLPWLLRKRKML